MKRHQARETAFKMLFQIDVGNNSMEMAKLTLEEAIAEEIVDPRDESFVCHLVEGVLRDKQELDAFIAKYAQGWKIDRINPVEKNIIRLALFEIRQENDIPFRIAINEAIELAKAYGDDESGPFVNGILDNAKNEPGFKEKEREQ